MECYQSFYSPKVWCKQGQVNICLKHTWSNICGIHASIIPRLLPYLYPLQSRMRFNVTFCSNENGYQNSCYNHIKKLITDVRRIKYTLEISYFGWESRVKETIFNLKKSKSWFKKTFYYYLFFTVISKQTENCFKFAFKIRNKTH